MNKNIIIQYLNISLAYNISYYVCSLCIQFWFWLPQNTFKLAFIWINAVLLNESKNGNLIFNFHVELLYCFCPSIEIYVGGIPSNQNRKKINMGNYKHKVARKLERSLKFTKQVVRIFAVSEGQCLWFSLGYNFPFSQMYFSCTYNTLRKGIFYNLGIHFINSYRTDTLSIPRLWCEISTSEYPCPHYDIFENVKPAKIINLENPIKRKNVMIWALTFTFFIHHPSSHIQNTQNMLYSITLRFLSLSNQCTWITSGIPVLKYLM